MHLRFPAESTKLNINYTSTDPLCITSNLQITIQPYFSLYLLPFLPTNNPATQSPTAQAPDPAPLARTPPLQITHSFKPRFQMLAPPAAMITFTISSVSETTVQKEDCRLARSRRGGEESSDGVGAGLVEGIDLVWERRDVVRVARKIPRIAKRAPSNSSGGGDCSVKDVET